MKSLEGSFGENTIGEHTTKDASADIRFLADILKDNSMIYKKGRSCQHHSLNLVWDGYDRLLSGALKKFRERFKPLNDPEGDGNDVPQNDVLQNDVPQNFGIFNFDVWRCSINTVSIVVALLI